MGHAARMHSICHYCGGDRPVPAELDRVSEGRYNADEYRGQSPRISPSCIIRPGSLLAKLDAFHCHRIQRIRTLLSERKACSGRGGDLLDELDLALIARLQRNAREPVTQLAQALKRPTATVRDRLRRLEESGIIQGYTVRIDMAKVGLPVKALVYISTSGQAVDPDEFLHAVGQIPELSSASLVTGEYEAVLTILARDVKHLSRILYEDLRRVPAVTGTTTSIVLLGRQFDVPRPQSIPPR